MMNTATIHDEDLVDAHRHAYNGAFYELGLRWHWDETVYRAVLSADDERERLSAYLASHQSHLLKAYDAQFLVDAILAAKERCYASRAACGKPAGAPVNWAAFQQNDIGI